MSSQLIMVDDNGEFFLPFSYESFRTSAQDLGFEDPVMIRIANISDFIATYSRLQTESFEDLVLILDLYLVESNANNSSELNQLLNKLAEALDVLRGTLNLNMLGLLLGVAAASNQNINNLSVVLNSWGTINNRLEAAIKNFVENTGANRNVINVSGPEASGVICAPEIARILDRVAETEKPQAAKELWLKFLKGVQHKIGVLDPVSWFLNPPSPCSSWFQTGGYAHNPDKDPHFEAHLNSVSSFNREWAKNPSDAKALTFSDGGILCKGRKEIEVKLLASWLGCPLANSSCLGQTDLMRLPCAPAFPWLYATKKFVAQIAINDGAPPYISLSRIKTGLSANGSNSYQYLLGIKIKSPESACSIYAAWVQGLTEGTQRGDVAELLDRACRAFTEIPAEHSSGALTPLFSGSKMITSPWVSGQWIGFTWGDLHPQWPINKLLNDKG